MKLKNARAQSLPGIRATPPAHESRDIVDDVTIRFAVCHFLLVVHLNRASISNRFRDIRPQNTC